MYWTILYVCHNMCARFVFNIGVNARADTGPAWAGVKIAWEEMQCPGSNHRSGILLNIAVSPRHWLFRMEVRLDDAPLAVVDAAQPVNQVVLNLSSRELSPETTNWICAQRRSRNGQIRKVFVLLHFGSGCTPQEHIDDVNTLGID